MDGLQARYHLTNALVDANRAAEGNPANGEEEPKCGAALEFAEQPHGANYEAREQGCAPQEKGSIMPASRQPHGLQR